MNFPSTHYRIFLNNLKSYDNNLCIAVILDNSYVIVNFNTGFNNGFFTTSAKANQIKTEAAFY